MYVKDVISECPQCHTDLTSYASLEKEPSFCLECKFPIVLVAGKYRLTHVLGEGGFGTVYFATHVGLTRNAKRVIKFLKPEVFEQDSMGERFYREVQVTSELSQRNMHIVRIYDDFGEIPNLGHFYVMEHLEGKALSEYVCNPKKLPGIPWCLQIFRQLCDAMQAAHEEGVIHRDLKPENLLLTQRRKNPYFLKILDFGIARRSADDTRLTQGVIGTPFYMSPEQGTNRSVDHRSDLYSMAILLYEMLTGYNPFVPPGRETISALELMTCHLMMSVPSMLDMRPERNIPKELDPIVSKALSKNPDDRYQSVEEFWEHIEAVLPAEYLDTSLGMFEQTIQEDSLNPSSLPELKNSNSGRNTGAAFASFAEALQQTSLGENQPSSQPSVPATNHSNFPFIAEHSQPFVFPTGELATFSEGQTVSKGSNIAVVNKSTLQKRNEAVFKAFPTETKRVVGIQTKGAHVQRGQPVTGEQDVFLENSIFPSEPQATTTQKDQQIPENLLSASHQLDKMLPDLGDGDQSKRRRFGLWLVFGFVLLLFGSYAYYHFYFSQPLPLEPDSPSPSELVTPPLRRSKNLNEPEKRESEPSLERKVEAFSEPKVKPSEKRVKKRRRRGFRARNSKRRLSPAPPPPNPKALKLHSKNQPCADLGFHRYIFVQIRPFSKSRTEIGVPNGKSLRVERGICVDPTISSVSIRHKNYVKCKFSLTKKNLRIFVRLQLHKKNDPVPNDYCIQ